MKDSFYSGMAVSFNCQSCGLACPHYLILPLSNILVPHPHTQLRGRTVIKKLWTFLGPCGPDHSQSPAMLNFSGKTNTSIHGLG